MVQISKRKVSDEITAKLFLLFFEIVGRKNQKEEFEKIIDDLFSDVEKTMIIKRIAIIYLLSKKIDQRTISKVLKVSPSTIGKFSIIVQKSDGIVPYFKKILAGEKVADFFEDILTTLIPPTAYGTDWKLGWKLEKDRQRRKRQGI